MRFLMMLLVLILAACSNPEPEKKQTEERVINELKKKQAREQVIKEAIGYKLATLSTGNNNLSVADPIVVKIMGDIKVIHQITGVPEEHIADMAYYGMNVIREKGVGSNADEVLDALRQLIEANTLNPRGDYSKQISSLITSYVLIRTGTDQDHKIATNSLLDISRAGQALMQTQ